jgi:hypothetical protein
MAITGRVEELIFGGVVKREIRISILLRRAG